MNNPSYTYRARVIGVYDADTIRVDWDLGAGVWIQNEPLRLFGLNAPEVRGDERPAGIEARDALRTKILHRDIVIETVKDTKGKYGRFLATIWLDGENVNKWLVDQGLAERRDY